MKTLFLVLKKTKIAMLCVKNNSTAIRLRGKILPLRQMGNTLKYSIYGN